jgi:hypothetical protein
LDPGQLLIDILDQPLGSGGFVGMVPAELVNQLVQLIEMFHKGILVQREAPYQGSVFECLLGQTGQLQGAGLQPAK